jgi:uncharacterized protein (DUF3084 family)
VSALTKTFVLLHVVMSMLLTAGLIVFVNRIDASATATKAAQARITRLEDEVRMAQNESTTIRAAQTGVQQQAQSQVAAARADLDNANRTILELRGQLADAQSQLTSERAALVSANEALKVAQNNQGALQGQLADLRTSQDKLMQQFTEANLSLNDLNNRLQQTERARRQLAEELASQQQSDSAPGGAGGRAGGALDGAQVASSRSRIEGVVRERRVIAGQPYATISIGSNDAISRGTRLNVLSQNGQWLGYVIVTNVEPEEAIGRLEGPGINQVRENDRVTNRMAGQG